VTSSNPEEEAYFSGILRASSCNPQIAIIKKKIDFKREYSDQGMAESYLFVAGTWPLAFISP
jgi:hypothetical protein